MNEDYQTQDGAQQEALQEEQAEQAHAEHDFSGAEGEQPQEQTPQDVLQAAFQEVAGQIGFQDANISAHITSLFARDRLLPTKILDKIADSAMQVGLDLKLDTSMYDLPKDELVNALTALNYKVTDVSEHTPTIIKISWAPKA